MLSILKRKNGRSDVEQASTYLPFIHPAFTDVQLSEMGNGYLAIGSPGSGKTSIIMPWLKKLVASKQKVITLDCKGEQREKLGINYMAPWLKGSLVLDIADTVRTEADAQLLANSKIPVPDSGKDKVWQAAANSVFTTMIYSLVTEKKGKWTWSDLADKADLSTEQWLELMMIHAPSSAKLLQGAAETSAGVAFNVATSLRELRVVARMFEEARRFGGKLFSPRRWLWEKNYDVRQIILRGDRRYAAAVGFIIPFIIDYIGTQISGLPESTDDPKNIVLDEFAQLPAIFSIMEYFEIGRSKGIFTLLATQDWLQVKQKYGDHRAASMFSTISNKVICQTSTSSSQSELAGLLGSQEVAIQNISQSSGGSALSNTPSVSTSYQEKTIQLFLPGELQTELGPHSYIKRGNKQVPTKIRAILQPKKGDAYVLDWDMDFSKPVASTPVTLPSQHHGFEIIRSILKDSERPMMEKVNDILKNPRTGIKPTQLADHLFSEKHIDKAEWSKAKVGDAEALKIINRLSKRLEIDVLTPEPEPAHAEQIDPALLQAVNASKAPAQKKFMKSQPHTEEQEQSQLSAIDDLILNHKDEHGQSVHNNSSSGPAYRFEGLQAVKMHEDHNEKNELLEDGADLVNAFEHITGIGHEASHAMHTIEHVTEAIELFERKQAPSPILTPTTPEEEPLTPLQRARARFAAKQTPQQKQ